MTTIYVLPKVVLQLIGLKLNLNDLGNIRATSRFFHGLFTPLWDHYVIPRITIREVVFAGNNFAPHTYYMFILTNNHQVYAKVVGPHYNMSSRINKNTWFRVDMDVPIKRLFSINNTLFLVSDMGDVYRYNGQGLTAERLNIGDQVMTMAGNAQGLCTLSETGTIYSNPHTNNRNHVQWKSVPFPIPIAAVTAGQSHYLCLTAFGEVFGIGINSSGQLGLGFNTQKVDRWFKLTDIKTRKIIAASDNSLIISEQDDVYGCGKMFGFLWEKITQNIREANLADSVAYFIDHKNKLLSFALQGQSERSVKSTVFEISEVPHAKRLVTAENGCIVETNSARLLLDSIDASGFVLKQIWSELTFNPFRLDPDKPQHVSALIHNRHRIFQPQLIKIASYHCDELFKALKKNKEHKWDNLFDQFKASLLTALEELPSDLTQRIQDLELGNFLEFYNDIRATMQLTPIEMVSTQKRQCAVM